MKNEDTKSRFRSKPHNIMTDWKMCRKKILHVFRGSPFRSVAHPKFCKIQGKLVIFSIYPLFHRKVGLSATWDDQRLQIVSVLFSDLPRKIAVE